MKRSGESVVVFATATLVLLNSEQFRVTGGVGKCDGEEIKMYLFTLCTKLVPLKFRVV